MRHAVDVETARLLHKNLIKVPSHFGYKLMPNQDGCPKDKALVDLVPFDKACLYAAPNTDDLLKMLPTTIVRTNLKLERLRNGTWRVGYGSLFRVTDNFLPDALAELLIFLDPL